MKKAFVVCLLLLVFVAPVVAQNQDPGWPREKVSPQGDKLVFYQPQVDDWKNFQELTARIAFTLTPAGGKPVPGVANLHVLTAVNTDTQMVLLSGIQVTSTYFPSLSPQQAAQMEQTLKGFLPQSTTWSLHRLVACVRKPQTAPTVAVSNDPPTIFVSYQPSILLLVDGQPAMAEVKHTKLQSVVNTNWPLFFDKDKSTYYLFTGKQWLTGFSLQGGSWQATTDLPKDFKKIPEDAQFSDLKSAIPPPPAAAGMPVPTIFYSNRPAEMIEFDGQAQYSPPISGTQLVYASNTDSILFVYSPTQQYYFLAAGRWFSAASLQGPWTYATPTLPTDFARIPDTSPAAVVLASVPGTEESKDAVMLAQIPTTVVVDPSKAAAQVKVTYSGAPQFQPIAGTSMSYATNTPNKVIQVGSLYYLCFQGMWFMSTAPQGPWQAASSVPQQIYTIPPSSPVYNVTYVTQTMTSEGNVQASYTAGYLGTFIAGAAVGAVIANGTGYYYHPYVGWGMGYPAYYPYAATYGAHSMYNPYTGAYGMGGGAYGPYGGAAWGAGYNPSTGTYARGATAYGPYGSRTAAEAYNPYTGGYAATRQGSSPYGSWGSSVVGNSSQWAAGQHVTTASGSYGAMETSAGGRAAASSTAYGNTGVAKTASGNMYAGHDGNVYKNTGSGWEKYDNGGWNSAGSGAQQHTQEMDQEMQNRQRGDAAAQNFQRSGGGWGGGSGWGGGERAGGSAWGGGERAGGSGGDRSFGGGGWSGHGGGSWGGARSSWGGGGGGGRRR
ncbi:MAG TPA: hypothetical protein VE825_14115 [Terriglobales bacterium]|jgi:hypothetical protein|nr:hypothetical protein [Terriglobales bacterium]